MTARQRVLHTCAFRPPDRVPRFEDFWVYPPEWQATLGELTEVTDVVIRVPAEGTFVTRHRVLRRYEGATWSVDEWGRVIRTVDGAFFSEVLEVPLATPAQVDSVAFDPPALDCRYLLGHATLGAATEAVTRDHQRFCVFGKTGGPFLRSCFVRGQPQFLMDLASDPPLARAVAERLTDHLIAVGLEEIRRWSLHQTGIWIYDDMAYNVGPMFSPRTFERVLLPCYQRMIHAYKTAGAPYVFLHSDGNIRPLLEMLAEAGIDGIHPVERRAGMVPRAIRRQFPHLILAGGMDNSRTLIEGPPARIEAEARELLEMGVDGGLIIGAHSIGPDVPLPHYLAYHRLCQREGQRNPTQPELTSAPEP